MMKEMIIGTPGRQGREGRLLLTPPAQRDTSERRWLVDLWEIGRELCLAFFAFVKGPVLFTFTAWRECVRACKYVSHLFKLYLSCATSKPTEPYRHV